MSTSITTSEPSSHVHTGAKKGPGSKVPAPSAGKMPKQKRFQVTLNGRQITASVVGLAALIRFLGPSAAIAAASLVPAVLYVRHDYQNFLDLGRGGTPYNFSGYLAICGLRLWALRDPYTARKPEAGWLPSKGILPTRPLPRRQGPKPHVVGIAPHRQVEQQGSLQCYRDLHETFGKLALKDPERFTTGASFIEGFGSALFARHPIETKYQGEICHIHDSEYSMHMALHPDDSKEVIQKGWGQRHPLAWKWWFITNPVSADFVLVYAPRDENELQVVRKIIQAAIWYTTAEEVDIEACL